MKKLKQLFIVFLSLAVVFSPVAGISEDMGQFMKNVLDQMGNLAPRAYKGQERGYFIGGQMSVRVPQDTIQPFSFTPPSYHAGCSGIDLTMGGFSYLNFDAIVQKLQAILQSAPFLAFDIAIGTLCQPCKAAMNAAESFSDFINSLNVNSCAAAQELVDKTMQEAHIHAIGSEAAKDIAGVGAYFKNLADRVNHAKQTMDSWVQDYQVGIHGSNGSSQDLASLAVDKKTTVSLLDQLVQISGYQPFSHFTGWLRYMIGDVTCTYDHKNGGAVCNPIPPLSGISLTDNAYHKVAADQIAKILKGDPNAGGFATITTKTASGAIQTPAIGTPLVKTVKDNLSDFLNKIRNHQTPTNNEISMVNLSPIPVVPFVKLCYIANDPDLDSETIKELSEPIAYGVFWVSMMKIHQALAQALGEYSKMSSYMHKIYSQSFIDGIKDMSSYLAKLVGVAGGQYEDAKRRFADKYDSFLKAYKQRQAEVVEILQQYDLYNSYLYARYIKQLEEGR